MPLQFLETAPSEGFVGVTNDRRARGRIAFVKASTAAIFGDFFKAKKLTT